MNLILPLMDHKFVQQVSIFLYEAGFTKTAKNKTNREGFKLNLKDAFTTHMTVHYRLRNYARDINLELYNEEEYDNRIHDYHKETRSLNKTVRLYKDTLSQQFKKSTLIIKSKTCEIIKHQEMKKAEAKQISGTR